MIRASFLLLSAFLLATGCARPTRPVRDEILLTLTLSAAAGDPARPITARAVFTNIGQEAVHFTVPCAGPGFGPVVRAPDRRNVVDACEECPFLACPTCAPGIVALQPGQSTERSYQYAGTLYTCDGPYEGPAGAYTVEAGMHYTRADGRVDSVSASATFLWSTTAPR
jgi:hypothetical protein